VVFKHDCGPSSLSSINLASFSYVFMLHWLVYVGEFRKTCHPQNVEVNEICDVSFQEQRTREDLESGTHEVSESRTRGGLES
jgi:hypothetical protein